MLPGFDWIEEGRLAAMGRPGPKDWPRLAEAGIGAVLSLTRRPPPGDPAAAGLEVLHVPVPDFGVPSDEDLQRALAWIRAKNAEGRAVLVHCLAGLGRTGTVVAAWLVGEGLTARDAIRRVRDLRPGSVETEAQAALVRRQEGSRPRGRRGRRKG